MPLTPDQAADAYIASSRRYAQAAEQKTYWANQEQSFRSQKQYVSAQISAGRTERINFEKRLAGIGEIIRILEGGGFFSANPPRAISDANQSIQAANLSYQKCVRLVDGNGAADMEAVFKAQTVDGDFNSGKALLEYKQEKRDLEQKIAELKARLAQLSDAADALTRQISDASAQQWLARSSMLSNAFDMNLYRHQM